MLGRCWLGIRKSIRPVKIEWWDVGAVICLQQGADCLHMVQLMTLHPKTPSSLASSKSRLVLSFWYWLTQAVREKRLLNRCSSSSSCMHSCTLTTIWQLYSWTSVNDRNYSYCIWITEKMLDLYSTVLPYINISLYMYVTFWLVCIQLYLYIQDISTYGWKQKQVTVLTKIQVGFPTAHIFTFLSSPPETITRPDLWPKERQFTLPTCAANSSKIHTIQSAGHYWQHGCNNVSINC